MEVYLDFDSPRDWARQADGVVSGHVADILPGRDFFTAEDREHAYSTFHLLIDVEDSIGTDAEGGQVAVELTGDGRLDAARARENLPQGARVLVFLSDFTDTGDTITETRVGGEDFDVIFTPFANGLFFLPDGEVIAAYEDLPDVADGWPTTQDADDFVDAVRPPDPRDPDDPTPSSSPATS